MNKPINLLAIVLFLVTNCFAQRPNYDIKNFLGLQGGISQFDIITDNFTTEQQSGWIAGLTGIVNVEHKWYDVSYGIQFTENKIGIAGNTLMSGGEDIMIDYKLSAAQLALLMHAKIVGYNFMIDFGPVIQANSKLELTDDDQQDYFVSGFDNLQASQIQEISKFNVNGAIGATAGLRNFRIRAQYQYGLTNMLNKLNDIDSLGVDFKGNQSQIILSAIVLF